MEEDLGSLEDASSVGKGFARLIQRVLVSSYSCLCLSELHVLCQLYLCASKALMAATSNMSY